jgi:hypothetical protein
MLVSVTRSKQGKSLVCQGLPGIYHVKVTCLCLRNFSHKSRLRRLLHEILSSLSAPNHNHTLFLSLPASATPGSEPPNLLGLSDLFICDHRCIIQSRKSVAHFQHLDCYHDRLAPRRLFFLRKPHGIKLRSGSTNGL